MQVFSKERCENRWNHRGMTVIEVLIVIVLMAVVLAPAVNALSTTTKIWSHNSAINPCISQANATMLWISRDIRGAAQPSSSEDSVKIEVDGNGECLIIYRYNDTDSKWEKVFYQINGDNQLKKIILSESDPADIITAAI
nr:type II secretion system protein [Syntrophomonadaceae bacterium]